MAASEGGSAQDSRWHTDGEGSCFPKVSHRTQSQGQPWAIGWKDASGARPRTHQLSRLCLFPDQFQLVPLQFSKDLDAHNPNTPEWREDVGLVVSRLLSKVPPAHLWQSHLGLYRVWAPPRSRGGEGAGAPGAGRVVPEPRCCALRAGRPGCLEAI